MRSRKYRVYLALSLVWAGIGLWVFSGGTRLVNVLGLFAAGFVSGGLLVSALISRRIMR